MAKSYVTSGSKRVPWVVSQTKVIDALQVSMYTQPSSVFVQVMVPYDAVQKGQEHAYLQPVAATIEVIIKDGLASGARYVEDVDTSTQLLAGFVDFTVSYTPAGGLQQPFTSIVRVPIVSLSSETAFTGGSGGRDYGLQIAQTYSKLVALSTQ